MASGLTRKILIDHIADAVAHLSSDEHAKLTALALPSYGGFYAYNKAITVAIITSGVYHAICLVTAGDFTSGLLSGWTFAAGRVVDANITSEANSGGLLRIVTSANHGLVTNDIVTLHGMNNAGHNKATKITRIDATTFDCQNVPYVAGAGASAGSVYEPAYLQASAAAAGNYYCGFVINGTALGANKALKVEVNVGIAPADNIVTERTTTATLAELTSGGHIAVASGDRVWLSMENNTDATDFTIKNMNVHLHRL